jgi:hypothetical protein
MNKTFLERKSVYHVPGTKCLLWSGIDTHLCDRSLPNFNASFPAGSGLMIRYVMSPSRLLHQCGKRPGIITTSPFTIRRLTPPSMRLPLRLFLTAGSLHVSTKLPPVTNVPAPSSIW